jgi:hypothetical protein
MKNSPLVINPAIKKEIMLHNQFYDAQSTFSLFSLLPLFILNNALFAPEKFDIQPK